MPMDISKTMRCFDASGADELAVLDDDRGVLGIVSESFARRRYAEEIERRGAINSGNGETGVADFCPRRVIIITRARSARATVASYAISKTSIITDR